MKIPISFERMFLDPGKTFAVATSAGSRVRVVEGLVWATTSGNPNDVWLAGGDEHTVREPGLTVIESVARSTVELFPHPPRRLGGPGKGRYDVAIPRALCHLAAVAMSVITLGLLVVLPAKISTPSGDALAATATLPAQTAVDGSGVTVTAREPRLAQATGGQSAATRVR